MALNENTKVLTVTVDGVSKTVDLSGVGGMKLVTKKYTKNSELYSDFRAGNIPAGAELIYDGSGIVSICAKFGDTSILELPCWGTTQERPSLSCVINSDKLTVKYFTGSGISSVSSVLSSAVLLYWE